MEEWLIALVILSSIHLARNGLRLRRKLLNVINLQDAMDIDHRYDEIIDEETNEDDDTTVLNYFTAKQYLSRRASKLLE